MSDSMALYGSIVDELDMFMEAVDELEEAFPDGEVTIGNGKENEVYVGKLFDRDDRNKVEKAMNDVDASWDKVIEIMEKYGAAISRKPVMTGILL